MGFEPHWYGPSCTDAFTPVLVGTRETSGVRIRCPQCMKPAVQPSSTLSKGRVNFDGDCVAEASSGQDVIDAACGK